MQKLGKITQEDGKRALDLYEKKMSLENLMKILDQVEDREIYIQVDKELSDINLEFDRWWQEMFNKYKWEIGTKTEVNAYIDFRENVVFSN